MTPPLPPLRRPLPARRIATAGGSFELVGQDADGTPLFRRVLAAGLGTCLYPFEELRGWALAETKEANNG
jgi:hypothetical protein